MRTDRQTETDMTKLIVALRTRLKMPQLQNNREVPPKYNSVRTVILRFTVDVALYVFVNMYHMYQIFRRICCFFLQFLYLKWNLLVPPKFRYLSFIKHGFKKQKAITFTFTTVRTPNLICLELNFTLQLLTSLRICTHKVKVTIMKNACVMDIQLTEQHETQKGLVLSTY
jgi:hypothetical protein